MPARAPALRAFDAGKNVLCTSHCDYLPTGSIQFTESSSSYVQARRNHWTRSSVVNAQNKDAGGIPMSALHSIAAFFRGLFGRKDDDFKTLLMSDLGIER